MRTGRIHLILKDKSILFFHPNDSILQAYVDGELKPPQVPIVAGHLENCSFCKRQVSQLKTAFLRFQEMQRSLDTGEKQVLVEGLERVREAIQDRQRQNLPVAEFQWETAARLRKMREQLSEEIGVYLGSRMTQALSKDLGKTLEDNQKLIMAAEPMLAAFFGQRAAARVHQIIFMLAHQAESGPRKVGPDLSNYEIQWMTEFSAETTPRN
jgi:anti-sigma factor RsiW